MTLTGHEDTTITKVPPLPEGRRPETGPMQFGNDWPGVFLRGDDSMTYSMALRSALEMLATIDGAWLEGATLVGLVDLLGTCRVTRS